MPDWGGPSVWRAGLSEFKPMFAFRRLFSRPALLAAGVSVLALSLAGCVGNDSASNTPSTTATEGSKPSASTGLKIGMVFDSGGRGDKSFNDSAYAGLEKAQNELGVEIKTVDSKNEKDYEGNLSTLAEQGMDLVIAVGLTQGVALTSVSDKFPKTKFAIVDFQIDKPNVRSLLFAEEQGSYLAGYVAGLTTKTNKVGFVGGMSIPLIKKFEAGYFAGAKAANPKVTALPSKYTESWDDVNLGKQCAQALYGDGADVVYHASGRCGIGVIRAAEEAKKLAIGVDSDQDDLAKGSVLTSMIKRVDEAVFSTIRDVKEGKFDTGAKIYDLKTNGVGLSDFRHTKQLLPADAMAKLDAVKKEIVEGKITVPKE
jgi:basic membrane protein A and related proteins